VEPLVEVHEPREIIPAQMAQVRMIGWNARDLADFSVRKAPAAMLRAAFPEALLIRESGLRTAESAGAALAEGFDALLIGEALMREPDPAAFLARIPKPAVRA
jgi:indole-3-glycerol phosphate synthase